MKTYNCNDSIKSFNSRQGRLRISITHNCQLRCQFCHQEGIDPHWVPIHMDIDVFSKLVNAYSRLGGEHIEITGGEPTLHPKISDFIDEASASNRTLTLCTNGLELNRVQTQITQRKINLIKLSLHASNSCKELKDILGNNWDFRRVEKNILAALKEGAKFQLIFTHSQQNRDHLEPILNLALKWDVDIQIVDLITSRLKRPAEFLGYVSGDETEKIVERYVALDHVEEDRTGSVLKIYKPSNGTSWEIKDYHYGLLHTRICDGCEMREDCGEGIYALRVDAVGIVKPCLLREDLQETIPKEMPTEEDCFVALQRTLEKMLT